MGIPLRVAGAPETTPRTMRNTSRRTPRRERDELRMWGGRRVSRDSCEEITGAPGPGTDALEELGRTLQARAGKLFGRSLAIRASQDCCFGPSFCSLNSSASATK